MVEHEITESPRAHALVEQIMDTEMEGFDFRKTDIHATAIGLIPMLVAKARLATAHYGDSYRGFLVGAAAVAYDTSPDNPRIGIYTSGNFKATHDEEDYDPTHDAVDIPKVCAEMDILLRADHDEMQRLGIFVVAATTNHQRILEVTKVRSATLHPCWDCEETMKGSSLVDNDTIILTVGAAKDVYQAQSYAEFRKRYKQVRHGNDFEDAETHEYRAADWPFRQLLYKQLVKKHGRGGNVYSPDARRELKRRKLALTALRAT
ncbi:MAG TPA: hypothetical protein VN778_04925 [Verrucomicrobiae bacterium]|nr:hypothetical protein [Verrucomicrobiae bacterium]